MKLLLTTLMLTLLTACGNPHLTKSAPSLEDITTPDLNPDNLRELILTNSDGGTNLSITTPNPSQNSILGARNPNTDSIIVTYAFQSGANFRFNGGSFPGTNGSCTTEELPSSDCSLDVEFFSLSPGVYTDNLIATYALKSEPSKTKTKIIPLRGERLVNNLQPIQLSPVAGGTEMVFQTSAGPVASGLNQLNPNAEEVIVSYRFLKGDNFRYKGGAFPGTNGNCSSEQLPNNTCAIEIEFFANTAGRYTDELIATYALKSNPSFTREVRMPLVGEKTAPLPSSISIRPMSGGSSINFGTATIGSALRTDRILIDNTGATNQSIEVRLLGGSPFSINNNCPAVLVPAALCTVDVTFASITVGTQNDIIRVTHSVSGQLPGSVNIPATGTTSPSPMRPGELVLAGTETGSIDFGTVELGTESRRLVEVRNIGEMPVNLRSRPMNAGPFGFSGGGYPGSRGTCGLVILPGSCTLELSFRPSAQGEFQGGIPLIPTEGATLNIGLRGLSRPGHPHECYRIEERQIAARPSAVSTGVIFPYSLSAQGTNARLSLLYGTATNFLVSSLNRRTVKDAQVFVSFDVPVITETILDMSINADVTKVIQDGHRDTESLCVSADNLRKCSGREFTLPSWQALRNPNFWSLNSSPMTTTYEVEFSRRISQCGEFSCYSMNKQLSSKAMFHLTTTELQGISGKAVNFIFSDDTRLQTMPTLTIKVKKTIACQ